MRSFLRKKSSRRTHFLVIGALLFILLLVYIFGYRRVMKIKADASHLKKAASLVKEAVHENDIGLLEKRLNDLEKEYSVLEKDSSGIYWMGFIPFLGGYVKDYKHGIKGGRELIEAAKISVEAIKPYADLIGFKKGEKSFVNMSAEDRLQTAILTLDKIIPKLDLISKHVALARENIHKINPNHYPSSFRGIKIRKQVKELRDGVDGFAEFFVNAKPLIKNLPNIFGKDKEQTYLVLFQNDKELRATGGFLTAYAVFKMDNGKMRISHSEDIYSLDKSISYHPKAPWEILAYHKNVYKFYIRDSNLSPDFPTSIKLFDSLYEKSSERVKYDGVIAIDSYVLVDMLKIFGDTRVDGVTFSSRMDKRCNCPQVIYKLSDIVDRPTPYIRENRKGILGDLMYALFYKAIGFSPSRYWGKLSQVMFSDLKRKHILLYFKNPELENSVVALGFGGKIKAYDGDYLHINDVNFAGAKSNMFVSHTISSKTVIKRDGTVERELTLIYKNPYKHSNCSLEAGGLCLNATLRNWLRVYVPKSSKLIEFRGSQKKVRTYEDLGKTVFEGFLYVYPQGMSEVIIKYTLPFKVHNSHDYKLLVQKQPGTDNYKLKATLNNKTLFNSLLNEDVELRGL